MEKVSITLASEVRTFAKLMETFGPTSHGHFQGLFDTKENMGMYATGKKLLHIVVANQSFGRREVFHMPCSDMCFRTPRRCAFDEKRKKRVRRIYTHSLTLGVLSHVCVAKEFSKPDVRLMTLLSLLSPYTKAKNFCGVRRSKRRMCTATAFVCARCLLVCSRSTTSF